MATSRAVRRPARLIVAAIAATMGLTITPGTGYAEPLSPEPVSPEVGATAQAAAPPSTAAQAQQQVAELSHRLEIVTEQYNDAKILQDQREADAALANAQLGQVQRDIADLDEQVREVAAGAYTGDPVAGFTAMMTSGSPQEFLDRLNTLDAISRHSNQLAGDLGRARQHAADLSAQAQGALAGAEAAAADLKDKQDQIETDLPTLQALLDTLTEQERQAALARSHEMSTAAATADSPTRRSEPTAPTAPSSPVVAPTAAAQIAVDTAYAQLGDPYQWGADGPDAFDCSGLTMYAYAAAGINLPHSSRAQSTMGMYVPRDQLLPGDLVFYYSPVSHEGIYIGNGQIIHAPNTGSVVSIQDVDAWDYNHAQRIALP